MEMEIILENIFKGAKSIISDIKIDYMARKLDSKAISHFGKWRICTEDRINKLKM